MRLLKNKEIKNASWIIGEQIFQMLISLVVGVLSARYLGPNDYGILNYTASFVNFFIPIATLGLDVVIIKKMVELPKKEGEYLGSCLLYRFLASIFSMLSVFFIVYVLNPNEQLKWILVFLQSFQLLFRALQIFDSWFQRYLKSKYVSIGKMIACILVSSYRIFLLATQKNIIWFAVSNTFTDLVIVVVMYLFYRKEKGQKLICHIKIGNEVLFESYHFIISGIMAAVYSQMDRIMIGNMLSDVDVGLYTIATTICGMWLFVPTAIINSFRTKIIEVKNSGDEILYRRRLEQLYSGIIWLCIFVSIGICVLSRFIVLVLYGEAYLGAVETLRIAIWFEMFAIIGTMRGIWIVCENKSKFVKYILGTGVIINIILNVLLIPSYGNNGAAIATLVTQIATSLIIPLFLVDIKEHTIIVIRAFLFRWYFETKSLRSR